MLPVTGFHLHHKSLKAAYGVRSSAVYSSSDIIGLEHLIYVLMDHDACLQRDGTGCPHALAWVCWSYEVI